MRFKQDGDAYGAKIEMGSAKGLEPLIGRRVDTASRRSTLPTAGITLHSHLRHRWRNNTIVLTDGPMVERQSSEE